MPDRTTNLDAESDFFSGPGFERHAITKPCILYIPGLSTIP